MILIMELRQIADAIGIGEYMPELDEIYATLPKTDAPACDLETIDRLQADYDTRNAAPGSKLPLNIAKITPAVRSTRSPCLRPTAQL